MQNYQFADDEYVVLKATEVRLEGGSKFSLPHTSELMLTNHNIVLPVKGITGKVKDYQVFPLTDIRVVNGRPQVRLDSSEFMEEKLEVSLAGGLATFVFGSLEGRKEIREWINAIYQILVGSDAPEDALGKGKIESFLDEEGIADAFGRVFGSFENALNRKRAEAAGEIAKACPSCNASLKGRPGETVACPYCGTYFTL